MMPLSLGALGLVLLVLRGFLHTVQLALGREVKDWEWPFFRMMAAACFFSSVIIATGVAVAQIPPPESLHRKWVVLRGVFGAGGFVCSALAAQLGTPLGDVEALRSINMVAAALLGKLFLDEPLGRPHLAALGLSVAGSLLVAQPSLLFGPSAAGPADSEASLAWLGYILAPVSGLCQAGIFVASRKAPGTSMWFQALSSHAMSVPAALLLPATPAVDDFSVYALAGSPWQATGLFGYMLGSTFLSTLMLSAASQWCTAAESAIVSTSAGMGFGYAAQTELFGATPDRLALTGAALMLGGVTVMAVAQVQPPRPADEEAADSKEQLLPLVADPAAAEKARLLNTVREDRWWEVAAADKARQLPLVAEDAVLDVSLHDVSSSLAALVPEDKLADLATRPAASDASTADADDTCDLQDDDDDDVLLPVDEVTV